MINTIGTTTAATTATPSAADYMKQTTGLNKDDFMKLFVTQLQNQDPTAPQDASQMVAQMAQLTQVEQSYNTNTNLQSILSAMNSSSSLSAVSFIGKTVSAQGNQVSLSPGSLTQLNFNLANGVNQLQVAIQDSTGRTVKTVTMGATAAGDGSVAWNGTDSNNSALPAGIYSFSVTGINADGSTFSGTPLIKGAVTGVNLAQGTPVLSVGGIAVPLANVAAVTGG